MQKVQSYTRFNPAEAEEWFKSDRNKGVASLMFRFNPAEAEEWFKSRYTED